MYRVIRLLSVTSPLRQTLGAHLGQVLTPELAALIEQATGSNAQALSDWRYLIEPVIQASDTPVSWERVLEINPQVYAALNSVVVVRYTPPNAFVWVAAGDLQEVLMLFKSVKSDASDKGCNAITYLGRRGWVRAAGFKESAVLGKMEV